METILLSIRMRSLDIDDYHICSKQFEADKVLRKEDGGKDSLLLLERLQIKIIEL